MEEIIGNGLMEWSNKVVDDLTQLRQWARTWREAGPELEAIRLAEVPEADNARVLALLESAFNHAAKMPPRESSGMVEMQAIFAKLRR